MRFSLAMLFFALGVAIGLGCTNQPDLVRQNAEALVLYNRGEYEKAAAILERIVGEIHNPADRAAVLDGLGVMYTHLGRYPDAECTLRRTVDLLRRESGQVPKLALALSNLAAVYIAAHHPSRARPYLKEALALHRESPGTDAETLSVVLNNLGEVERARGNLREAEVHYRQALEVLEQAFGGAHAGVPAVLLNLSALHEDRGEALEAIRYARRALDILTAWHGMSHPMVATGFWHLARGLAALKRFEEADTAFRQAREIAETRLGPEHPRTGEILLNYAELLRKMNRKQEAKQLKQRASAIFEQIRHEDLLRHSVHWTELQTR